MSTNTSTQTIKMRLSTGTSKKRKHSRLQQKEGETFESDSPYIARCSTAIKTLFKTLNTSGGENIIAVHAVGDSSSDGGSIVRSEYVRDWHIGYVYYTATDMDDAEWDYCDTMSFKTSQYSNMFLYFGVSSESDHETFYEDSAEFAKNYVIPTLKELGIKYEWNGSGRSAIEIPHGYRVTKRAKRCRFDKDE